MMQLIESLAAIRSAVGLISSDVKFLFPQDGQDLLSFSYFIEADISPSSHPWP